MIFSGGSGSNIIQINHKRAKYVKHILTAVLLVAATPLFASHDYNTLIRSAAAMSPANSVKMLDSLSRTQGAPAAQALRLLGDHAFIKEDYKKAAGFYKQASERNSSSIYRHLHALAAALDGQTAAAREIWNTISENLSDNLSTLAAFHLAYLEMQELNWAEAYAILQSAAPADTASPLYIPFVWEMLECSREMKRSERVAFHEKQLAVFKGHILESNETSFSPVSLAPPQNNRPSSGAVANANTATNTNTEKPQTAAVKNPDTGNDKRAATNTAADKRENNTSSPQNAIFTIQVGAFGSKDNAENLVKRLSENYRDVVILPPAIGGPVLYRVRVGSFVNRDEAEVMAQKLTAAGMSPRVVEK